MHRRRFATILILPLLATTCWAQTAFPEPAKVVPTDQDLGQIRGEIAQLGKLIESLPKLGEDHFADIAIFHKAAEWIDRHHEYYNDKYAGMTLKVLGRGRERAQQAKLDNLEWDQAEGSIVRGFISKVDSSVQPYCIIVPKGYDGLKRQRLDVILHGRGATLNEVSFLAGHDGKPAPAAGTPLTLHIFGRTNNAYRWAGETDVFEAVEAVKRHYPVDESKIVLQGFSMGGAGAWHLGLHHPNSWRTVEAGAGFTETKNYAKLKETPEPILKGLHIYDSTDYATNAANIPMVGYGGEDDPQLQASSNIIEVLKNSGVKFTTEGLLTKAEGLDFLRIVGAKMGHKVDPASRKLMDVFHNERVDKPRPTDIDFVTYTLKYPKAGWLRLVGLRRHYELARIQGKISGETAIVTANDNITLIAIDRQVAETVRINGQSLPLRAAAKGLLPDVYYQNVDAQWRLLEHQSSLQIEANGDRRKVPGIQGPIDDAFTSSFLIVKGTGKPTSPQVQEWADRRLEQFAKDWDKWLRGKVRIKNDVDVTDEDIAAHHLIAFGDPGSNGIIARTLADLPLKWPSDASITPTLITANPLNPRRYLVINSGHTFGSKEFSGTNALLYPRMGDWGTFSLEGNSEKLIATGYFDEGWKP